MRAILPNAANEVIRGAAARANDLRGLRRGLATRDGEFADKFNSMPKYVVSSTLEEPEWNNSTVLERRPRRGGAKLKQEQDGDIVVHGSATLVQALIEHDLVDEFRLMVFPVVLGSGKRLFGETTDKKRSAARGLEDGRRRRRDPHLRSRRTDHVNVSRARTGGASQRVESRGYPN